MHITFSQKALKIQEKKLVASKVSRKQFSACIVYLRLEKKKVVTASLKLACLMKFMWKGGFDFIFNSFVI